MKTIKKLLTVSQGAVFYRTLKMQSNFSKYRFFLPIQTRCADNDYYGHVNNSQYHFYCDTIVNTFLIWYCGLSTDRVNTTALAYMVQTHCTYKKPLIFPQVVLAGLGVKKLGNSSVQYEVAIFEPKLDYNTSVDVAHQKDPRKFDPLLVLGIGSQGLLIEGKNEHVWKELEKHYESSASVIGSPVHVFVDPGSHRPLSSLPGHLLSGLSKIQTVPGGSKL